MLFRGLILEGVACSGKSTLLRALLAHPNFVHRPGASTLVLTEHHTQRVLERLGSRNALTVHDNLNLLREHTSYLCGIASRLEAMARWNDPASENPRTQAVLERVHLSHVLNYQHLAWSDVAELDRDLAALHLTLCLVTARPDEIRRRIHTRAPEWGAFLQEAGQRHHLRERPTPDFVADYFVRQQDELLELAARSHLRSVEIDSTSVQPSDATELSCCPLSAFPPFLPYWTAPPRYSPRTMPARVLIYCKKSVADVTADMLAAELREVDLVTLAEALDLPEGEEAAVEKLWSHLRFEPAGSTIHGLEIHWHEHQRPIQVVCGPPLPGEMDETLEELPDSDRPEAIGVREHLATTTQVVSLEMGIDGSQHLAATISEVVAFYLAERGDGIVWFYHREFASPHDRGATLWQTAD